MVVDDGSGGTRKGVCVRLEFQMVLNNTTVWYSMFSRDTL